MVSKLCGIYFVFLVFWCAHGIPDTRSNVAFVIDDTYSMGLEIEQVKASAEYMFKSIYESRNSLVEDFILVTFNDYEVFSGGKYWDDYNLEPIKVRAKTKDPQVFLNKLKEIIVNGGGGCPELCLKGILSAIELCNPYSFLYVFTDADPRDIALQKKVEDLALQKSIQITFLLTQSDYCERNTNIYQRIAKATSGEVFELEKDDVDEIIKYIIHCMRSPQTPILTVPIKPGNNNINFTADNDMKNLSIKVNVPPNNIVNLNVIGPEGNEAATEDLVNTGNTKIANVPSPGNGSYVLNIQTDGTGETSVKATVSIDFKHGFCECNPTSLKTTRTRPVPDVKSYLAIQLILTGTIDANLEIIQILDLNDKIITTMPAHVKNEKEKFYITSPFEPPNHIFKIKILVVDPRTGNKYERIGRTPVQPQSNAKDKVQYKTPSLTIENSPKVKVKYDESVSLECIVKASPKPTIVWLDNDTGLELTSKVSILEYPDEYISQLMIDNVKKPGVYKCKATSSRNEVVMASIEVETFRPEYFNTIETPKDTSIDYKNDGKIFCKINAWPLGYIEWYRDDKKIIEDSNYEISDDKSTLLVKDMRLELEGTYSCRVGNENNYLIYNFTLSTSGLALPEIDSTGSSKTVIRGAKAKILCRITKGIPKPVINLEFKENGMDNFISIVENEEELIIESADLKDDGVYRCIAKNIAGKASKEIKLTVQVPPLIEKFVETMTAAVGTKTMVSCRILKGIPQPQITWEFRRKHSQEFINIQKEKPEIYLDPVDLGNTGTYKCLAKNEAGEDFHEINFIVLSPPTVTVKESIKMKVDEPVTLSCDVVGEPKPNVNWIRDGKIIEPNEKYTIFRDYSLRFIARVEDEGNYTCKAENSVGNDTKISTVQIYGLIKISPPEKSSLDINVGTDVKLWCNASGIPPPLITWEFYPPNDSGKIEPTILKKSMEQSLKITRIQADGSGYYKCTAINGEDKKTITYEIRVNAPVEIEVPNQTEFSIVEQDIVLKIPCKATGNPKPTVTWLMNYMVLVIGDLYSTDNDGTLIIKNPNESAAGIYLCIADNHKTAASQEFTVNFKPFPDQKEPTETIYIEEGTSTEVKCKLPHNPVDTIRWYKNGKLLTQNKWIIRDAKIFDTGVYSCRVSTFQGSQTAHLKIEVGTKPEFLNKKDNIIIIPFIRGGKFYADCKVEGKPTPTLTWWQNGVKQEVTTPRYAIEKLDSSHLGEIRCEAKNEFGVINRTYVIKIEGCTIDYFDEDSKRFHPILLLNTGRLAHFENENGKMILPERQDIEFVCPDNKRKGYCNKNEIILIDNSLNLKDRHVKYADLKCFNEVIPKITQYKFREKPCSSDKNTRLYNVGYQIQSSFTGVYDVCINVKTQKQVFIRHIVTPYASSIKIGSHPIVTDYVPPRYEDKFRCWIGNAGLDCCFVGRQQVTPQDLPPAIQKAAYYSINLLPQFDLCGYHANLDEIEIRIRELAKSIRFLVEVFSGGLDNLYKADDSNQVVPDYLWKIVQLRELGEALAIVTINVPNLTADEVKRKVFCEDICHLTDWMNNSAWHDVKRGYTFCCKPLDIVKRIDSHFNNLISSNIILSKNIK